MAVREEVWRNDIPGEKTETGMDRGIESMYYLGSLKSTNVSVRKCEYRNIYSNMSLQGWMGPCTEGTCRGLALV